MLPLFGDRASLLQRSPVLHRMSPACRSACPVDCGVAVSPVCRLGCKEAGWAVEGRGVSYTPQEMEGTDSAKHSCTPC